MADVAITAGNVAPIASSTESELHVAGETITAGQVLFLKSSDGRVWKADANDATAENRDIKGVAGSGGAAGQAIVVFVRGTYTAGGTLVAGQYYFLSTTAGGIAPHADLSTAGMFSQRLGYATTTAILKLDILNTDIAIA